MVNDATKAMHTRVRLLMMASGAYTLDQINEHAPGLADELLALVRAERPEATPTPSKADREHELDRQHWQRLLTDVYEHLKGNRVGAALERLELFRWDHPDLPSSGEAELAALREAAECAHRVYRAWNEGRPYVNKMLAMATALRAAGQFTSPAKEKP